MQEHEFFEEIYQGWTRTTGAETRYWMPVELPNNPGQFKIVAVDEHDNKTCVATLLSEDDSAWITALHGSFSDVYRRCLESFDEADRLDEELDTQIGRVADLLIENDALRKQIERQENDLMQLDNDYLSAKGEAEYWKEQAGE